MLAILNNLCTIIENGLYYLTTSQTTIKRDREYIQSLIVGANFNMSEVRDKTEFALQNKPKKYSDIVSYVSGNAWLNSKISKGDKLSDIDNEIYKSINDTVKETQPLSYPITLFHGFERFTMYNEHIWKLRHTIYFPWFLSKTPSFDVALRFASTYDNNKFRQKFMVVNYPVGSKHIGLDIRAHDDEFEYLSKSGENLKLVRICKVSNFPYMMIFYVFKSKDYPKSKI